ncbi:hydantoinase/oxoprolinase family protein [Streptomyces avermitilis]|uniref:hydantoinase/oxoprolinase family protein n=1 Tax=Streptomyces avermitilis TaxID=33903 RepID=UPI0033A28F03
MARIGVDVGGTHTDAVLMSGSTVLATVKRHTSQDVTSGIVDALQAGLAAAGLQPKAVQAVMIGTTHFTNAVVERRGITPVAVIRLGLPATRALPPFSGWPASLRQALGEHVYLCHGGHEFDGRHISSLDESEIRMVVQDLKSRGLSSVAVTSVFSPMNDGFEQRVAEIIGSELPNSRLSLSCEIGRLGLLQRENATILNACLRGLADGITDALASALHTSGIDAPLFLSRNDGTVMDLEHASRYPVMTFSSGPTNSMRGAAFLSGLSDCVVVDIGGTTSDIGVLTHQFPREATLESEIGGVRTNFRMPDVLSIGLGGGSVVRGQGERISIGPDSVGHELPRRAMVFGGDTLTATDLAVAGGLADIGDRSLVDCLEAELVAQGLHILRSTVLSAVDRMLSAQRDLPLIMVGGGSVLLPDRLEELADVRRPEHYAVANAIGAAIAQVSGEVDRIVSSDGEDSRAQLLDQAKVAAAEKAVSAGASPATVTIVEVDEVPLTYLPGRVTRLRVKAVGDLEISKPSAP